MSRFYEGARVRVTTDDNGFSAIHVGMLGTVVTAYEDGDCMVDFVGEGEYYMLAEELEIHGDDVINALMNEVKELREQVAEIKQILEGRT